MSLEKLNIAGDTNNCVNLEVELVESSLIVRKGSFVVAGKKHTLEDDYEFEISEAGSIRKFDLVVVSPKEGGQPVVVVEVSPRGGRRVAYDWKNGVYTPLFALAEFELPAGTADLKCATGFVRCCIPMKEKEKTSGKENNRTA